MLYSAGIEVAPYVRVQIKPPPNHSAGRQAFESKWHECAQLVRDGEGYDESQTERIHAFPRLFNRKDTNRVLLFFDILTVSASHGYQA